MDKSIDNFYTLLIVFLIGTTLYFVFFKSRETFEAKEAVPAPATIIKSPEPILVERTVSPSGPNPPNAKVSNKVAQRSETYNVIPSDPYDETYGSQNIQDNLRYPERSFNPGIINDGNRIINASGVASSMNLNSPQPVQLYKPELIQNGGLLDGVGPDDTQSDPNYATF
jgi:hypothetical protein